MKWTVVWKPSARRRLADLWIKSSSRQELADAANRIDWLLKFYADTVGQPMRGNRRMLTELPLGVIFKVSPPDRMAMVLGVWELPEQP